MLVIHQENPLVGTLVMKDGLPETTKSDRRSHGYGMKSINTSLSKYGGRHVVTAARKIRRRRYAAAGGIVTLKCFAFAESGAFLLDLNFRFLYN